MRLEDRAVLSSLAMASVKGKGRRPRKVVVVPRKTRELRHQDTVIPIPVRESSRSKRLRISVGSHGVRMSVPRGTAEREIDRFIASQETWIVKTLRSQSQPRSNRLGLQQAGVVWHQGEPIKAVRSNGVRSRAFLALYQGERVLAVSGPRDRAAAAIDSWCREQLRLIAEEIIEREAPQLGVTVKKLRIGDQRTRWGSASSNGTISLSWRLLLAPRQVIEYVVIHELCHLLEMNHSKRFWAHVARRWPSWKEERKWLQEHEGELHHWSPKIALTQPLAG